MVMNVVKVHSQVYVIYQKLKQQKALFDYPLTSTDINIFIAGCATGDYYTVPCELIARKCVRLPCRNSHHFSVVPFAHRE